MEHEFVGDGRGWKRDTSDAIIPDQNPWSSEGDLSLELFSFLIFEMLANTSCNYLELKTHTRPASHGKDRSSFCHPTCGRGKETANPPHTPPPPQKKGYSLPGSIVESLKDTMFHYRLRARSGGMLMSTGKYPYAT